MKEAAQVMLSSGDLKNPKHQMEYCSDRRQARAGARGIQHKESLPAHKANSPEVNIAYYGISSFQSACKGLRSRHLAKQTALKTESPQCRIHKGGEDTRQTGKTGISFGWPVTWAAKNCRGEQ